MIYYDSLGIKRDTKDLDIVVGLEKLKATSGRNPWPVIEAIFKLFQDKKPTAYKSHLFYIDGVRETRRDKKFASSKKDLVNDGVLRYTLDIPEFVMKAIRFIYSDEELPMNREFFLQFAKRFPNYKIAEKV